MGNRVKVRCIVGRETEKGMSIIDHKGNMAWLPQSEIISKLSIPGEKYVTIEISTWLAELKRLWYD